MSEVALEQKRKEIKDTRNRLLRQESEGSTTSLAGRHAQILSV